MEATIKRAAARFLVMAALAAVSWPATGQETPFQRVEVSLWPEYDRPSVLVIHRVTLPGEVSLPATVRVRVPAAAGQPNAVAEADASGNLVIAPYERTVDGEWAVLTIDVDNPRFQIEYYDPGLERDGSRRTFRFRWPGTHPVRSFVVDVQEPVGTTEMRVTPPSPGAAPGADGLMHHTIDLGPVPAGAERVVELDYVRDQDALSADTVTPPPAPATVPQGTAQGGGDANGGVWHNLAVGAGTAAIAGLLAYWFLFLRGGSAAAPAATASRGRSRRSRGEGKRFCTACGTAVEPADRFCPSCGTELR